MKKQYKVLVGSVRTDKGEISVGNIVKLTDKDGKELIRIGVVKKYVKEDKPEVVVEEQPEVEATEPKVEVVAEVEPSIDWTRSELNDYAKGIEIENPESLQNKQAVLDAIKEAK